MLVFRGIALRSAHLVNSLLRPGIAIGSSKLAATAACLLIGGVFGCVSASGQAKATSTALTLTSKGEAVTQVAPDTTVTLTATVKAGSAAVTPGQVKFCEATAKYCTDIHLLGTAQLTSAGTASLHLRPGLGTHSYKAVFAGTKIAAGSASAESSLAVTGTVAPLATTTSIVQAGAWGSYTLSATVAEVGSTAPPTGTVSFLDTSNGNLQVSKGLLGASTQGLAWQPAQSLQGRSPGSLAVGDFNGDGIPDLASIGGGAPDFLTIYLAKGDGTFTTAPASAVTVSQAGGMTVGDFNNDGIQDIAISDRSAGSVAVLLGHGDGTFTMVASSPATGKYPISMTTGDFNGDGNLDLAVVDQNGITAGSITILFGNGNGAFTAASVTHPVGIGAFGVITGDFNGDGKTDLAVTDTQGDKLSILLGQGDGTFTDAASPLIAWSCATINVADFNGDGIPDLIVGCQNGDLVQVLLGVGDGTFTAAPVFPLAGFGPTLADFNEDGIPDVAIVGGSAFGYNFVVFLGNGDGTFQQSSPPVTLGFGPGHLIAADFNGDGRPDLAIAGGYTGPFIFLTEPTEAATATASTSLLAGLHQVDASYGGSSQYLSSLSGTLPLWGTPPATAATLTLTAGGQPAASVASGTIVTLTAKVTVGTTPVARGSVAFCDAAGVDCTDIHLLQTVALSASGTAAFKFVPGPGRHRRHHQLRPHTVGQWRWNIW